MLVIKTQSHLTIAAQHKMSAPLWVPREMLLDAITPTPTILVSVRTDGMIVDVPAACEKLEAKYESASCPFSSICNRTSVLQKQQMFIKSANVQCLLALHVQRRSS